MPNAEGVSVTVRCRVKETQLTHMNARFLICFAIALGSLQAQNTLKDTTIQRYWNPIRRNLEATAEVVPADKMSFKLTPPQFSLEGWLNHSTERNYLDCS